MSVIEKNMIGCLVCGNQNYCPPAAPDKIINCSKCGAPVYDHTRPATVHDFKAYRDRLSDWGKQYGATIEAKNKIKAQLPAHSSQQGIAPLDAQVQRSSQTPQIATLQADLETQKAKCKSLEETHVNLQADLENQKAKCKSLEEIHANLQADLENQKARCKFSEDKHDSFCRSVEQHIRQIYVQEQEESDFLDEKVAIFAQGWKKYSRQRAAKNEPAFIQLYKLMTDDSAVGGFRQWIELSEAKSKDGSDSEAVGDDSKSEQQSHPSEKKADVVIELADSAQPPEHIKEVTDNTPAPVSEPKSFTISQTVEAVAPVWLDEYNALESSIASRQFRKRSNAISLIVSQKTLENQRVALDDSDPILLAGAGSYWCIYDEITKIYFLLLNRETFRFNDTNYESITACYDFNDFTKQNIKFFKANDYKLNTYEIRQPAQVIPTKNEKEWQLSVRGRLVFPKKVSS